MMGSEIYLYFELLGKKTIARVPSKTRAKVGMDITLAVDTENVHLFDKETERAIH